MRPRPFPTCAHRSRTASALVGLRHLLRQPLPDPPYLVDDLRFVRLSTGAPSLLYFVHPDVPLRRHSSPGDPPLVLRRSSSRCRAPCTARRPGRWSAGARGVDPNAFSGSRPSRAASSGVSSCFANSASMTCASRSVVDRFTFLFFAVTLPVLADSLYPLPGCGSRSPLSVLSCTLSVSQLLERGSALLGHTQGSLEVVVASVAGDESEDHRRGRAEDQLGSSPGWDSAVVVARSYRLLGHCRGTDRRKPRLHRHDLPEAAAGPLCAVVVLRES